MEIFQSEKEKEKRMKKYEQSQRPGDTIKHTNAHIMGIPEGEEREQEAERISGEIIAENSSNLF